jgi:hypothetical protein
MLMEYASVGQVIDNVTGRDAKENWADAVKVGIDSPI